MKWAENNERQRKILRYFSATGEEAKDMAIRLLDIADSVDRGRPFAVGLLYVSFCGAGRTDDCGSHENGGGENFRRIS